MAAARTTAADAELRSRRRMKKEASLHLFQELGGDTAGTGSIRSWCDTTAPEGSIHVIVIAGVTTQVQFVGGYGTTKALQERGG